MKFKEIDILIATNLGLLFAKIFGRTSPNKSKMKVIRIIWNHISEKIGDIE